MSATSPTPIGVVADYNLLERLEPAGPGELYRARDTRHGRTVVVRLLPASFATNPRTLVEGARPLTSLSHPNVIAFFDVGIHQGRAFLVFEFLKGQSLRGEMAGRALNVRRAIDFAVQIADAIADAHAAGYLHGGLSPDSVVVTAKGHAKIPAFELATRSGFQESAADSRLHDYEAPEEARGQRPDERSDIYSIGAILYEMLTTRRPSHRGASAPSASNPHAPKELDDVVLKAVAPNPESRYQSAAALAADLRSVGAAVDVRGGAGDEDDRLPEPSGGPRPLIAVAVLIVLVVAAIVWWLTRG
jgi:serine/threonine protein kinase